MRLNFEYDKYGGYDCMSPAYLVVDADENIMFVIDLANFAGYQYDFRSNPNGEETLKAKKEALALAERLCLAYNKMFGEDSDGNNESVMHIF